MTLFSIFLGTWTCAGGLQAQLWGPLIEANVQFEVRWYRGCCSAAYERQWERLREKTAKLSYI